MKNIFGALLFLLIIQSVYAGHDGGNGGDVRVCFEDNKAGRDLRDQVFFAIKDEEIYPFTADVVAKIQSVKLVDLVEFLNEQDLIKSNVADYLEIYEKQQQILKQKFPYLSQELSYIDQSTVWKEYDGLVDIKDEGISTLPYPNCLDIQIAIRYSDKLVKYDSLLFSLLLPLHQAALRSHENLWFYHPENSQSDRLRYINNVMYRESFADLSTSAFIMMLKDRELINFNPAMHPVLGENNIVVNNVIKYFDNEKYSHAFEIRNGDTFSTQYVYKSNFLLYIATNRNIIIGGKEYTIPHSPGTRVNFVIDGASSRYHVSRIEFDMPFKFDELPFRVQGVELEPTHDGYQISKFSVKKGALANGITISNSFNYEAGGGLTYTSLKSFREGGVTNLQININNLVTDHRDDTPTCSNAIFDSKLNLVSCETTLNYIGNSQLDWPNNYRLEFKDESKLYRVVSLTDSRIKIKNLKQGAVKCKTAAALWNGISLVCEDALQNYSRTKKNMEDRFVKK